MKYEIKYNNYGPSYVVRIGEERYVMVNLELESVMEQDLPILLQFGMWEELTEEPSLEICKKIEAILAL